MRESVLYRECIDCLKVLPILKFECSSSGSGMRHQCRRCRHIKTKYKISGKTFYKMLKDQLNCCLICENDIDENSACIDHCHSSGIVRGLLCINCNFGIGHFKHNEEIVFRGVEYLRKYSTNVLQ